jgi:hypothetical protein
MQQQQRVVQSLVLVRVLLMFVLLVLVLVIGGRASGGDGANFITKQVLGDFSSFSL